MNTEHIETIRKACIAANPEIVELTYDCRFKEKKYGKQGRIIGENILFRHDGDYQFHVFVMEDKASTVRYMTTEEGIAITYDLNYIELETIKIEIIGRPIRLADVLFAIGTRKNIYAHSSGVLVDFDAHLGKHGAEWNLRADDLTQQTDETLAFLANLLRV